MANTEAEFLRMLDLAAQTVEAALGAMPDEVSVHTTPFVSLLNSIQGPARRAAEVLAERHTSLAECMGYVMGQDNIIPKRVYVIITPAADGGVRLMAFQEEAAAAAVLDQSGPDVVLASLLIDQDP